MYLSILTHNREVPLSSDYINYMFPANKLFNSCIELRSDTAAETIPASSIKDSSLAGPLRKLPNDLTGEKRLQQLKEKIDRSVNVKATMATDRAHWKNKGVLPSKRYPSVAPIQPSTSLSNAMKIKGGRAMAVGIVLQKGRAMLLYDIVRQNVKALAKRVKTSNPESSGCVLIVNIKYLKVEREYGKAPQLSQVTLDHLIPSADESGFESHAYLREKISSLCEVSARKRVDTKFSIVHGETDESYSTAILFIKCVW